VSYQDDLHFGIAFYTVPSDVASIQREIMTNGSVESLMTLFADFEQYKSGVYRYTNGTELGSEAVRIVGWGVDSTNTPYWTATIAWGPNWGNNGFFWILRGHDECNIETYVYAGTPKPS